jgi:hypothetical protein
MANTINVTSDTVVKLIIRRGTDADRQSIVLSSGELGYAIDTKRVYIGDGITLGGTLVGNKSFGIVHGIQQYADLAQQGDIVYQSVANSGKNDNVLYMFNNGQWVPVSPQYSSDFSYATGTLQLNPAYLVLDTINSTLNVYNSVNTSTLSASMATIYNQPVFDTDGTNKLYVDTSITNAEAIDQAYTRNYVGSNYVPLSGSATMFGTLSSTVNVSVSSAPTLNADLTNKLYVDTNIKNALDTAVAYTSNRYLPLSGGTLTDALTSNVTRNDVPAVVISQYGSAQSLVIQDTNRTTPRSFYVDNYGSVGVGMQPPNGGDTQLTVLGTISASNQTTAPTFAAVGTASGFVAYDRTGGSNTTTLYRNNNVSRLWDNTAGDVIAYTSTGKVGINSTTPAYTLDVNGTLNANGNGTFSGLLTAGTFNVNTINAVSTTSTAVTATTINTGSITTSSNVTVGGNITTAGAINAAGDIIAFYTSDERLKDNVKTITSALDKIDNIRGVEYDWNVDLQATHAGHDVGVLAQEIESVIPEAVVTRPDGYKAVNYEKIIPLLIQAIKELKANQK